MFRPLALIACLIRSAFRIQWLKSRANAARFREELILLEEEMRRVLAFTHWQAMWWRDKGSARPTENPHLSEGLRAYAHEQAHSEQMRAVQLSNRWFLTRERAKIVAAALCNNTDMNFDATEIVVELEEDDDDDAMELVHEESEIAS